MSNQIGAAGLRGAAALCALRVSRVKPIIKPEKIVSAGPAGTSHQSPFPMSFADQSRAQRRAQLIGEGRDESNGRSNSDEEGVDPFDSYRRDMGKQKVVEAQDEVDGQLESILRTTEEIQATGADTNLTLAKQGQGLRQALNDVDDIDENMDQAEYHIQRMELCCCVALCCCCCSCCQPEKKNSASRRADAARFKEPLLSKGAGPAPSRGRRGRDRPERIDDPIMDDPGLTEEQKFDRRVDKKLDNVLKAVQNIEDLSKDMKAEIEYQNKDLIPELGRRVDENHSRVKAGNTRAKRL